MLQLDQWTSKECAPLVPRIRLTPTGETFVDAVVWTTTKFPGQNPSLIVVGLKPVTMQAS